MSRDEGALRAACPGSSAGIHCHQDDCVESLVLSRTAAISPTHEDDYRALLPALDEAALSLGWRVYRSVWWCPTHVVAGKLACARCLTPCPGCPRVAGPRVDAVDGDDEENDR